MRPLHPRTAAEIRALDPDGMALWDLAYETASAFHSERPGYRVDADAVALHLLPGMTEDDPDFWPLTRGIYAAVAAYNDGAVLYNNEPQTRENPMARLTESDKYHVIDTVNDLRDFMLTEVDPEEALESPSEVIMLSSGYAEVWADGDVVQHGRVIANADDLADELDVEILDY